MQVESAGIEEGEILVYFVLKREYLGDGAAQTALELGQFV